jgi:hypothetical protein
VMAMPQTYGPDKKSRKMLTAEWTTAVSHVELLRRRNVQRIIPNRKIQKRPSNSYWV